MQRPIFVTFDCYNTLVEFQRPIDQVTRQILGSHAGHIDVDDFLRAFADLRYQTILGFYRPYHEVLRQSLAQTMRRFRLPYQDEDGATLVAAVPSFGPFPEVPAALERLRQRCKIVVISNTDDDIIAGNMRNIGVPFDHVITSEQARAYKPSPVIFRYALQTLGCDAGEILHVAQGFEYDIIPAHREGWAQVWINRYGKTGDPAYGPYHELPDLSRLPELIGM
ncbi:MAG: haloacid dehalogenase type II [Chloroflexota bacterium]|nr:haloacid dehalogenase type II [Chloroflexota bacterium]